jgi:hypothetical protein
MWRSSGQGRCLAPSLPRDGPGVLPFWPLRISVDDLISFLPRPDFLLSLSPRFFSRLYILDEPAIPRQPLPGRSRRLVLVDPLGFKHPRTGQSTGPRSTLEKANSFKLYRLPMDRTHTMSSFLSLTMCSIHPVRSVSLGGGGMPELTFDSHSALGLSNAALVLAGTLRDVTESIRRQRKLHADLSIPPRRRSAIIILAGLLLRLTQGRFWLFHRIDNCLWIPNISVCYSLCALVYALRA